MSDRTPILSLPEVSPNQTQKEATINTALAIVEAAMNETIGISLAAGNVTLNTDQFTKAFLQQYVGHTVARTVTIPSTVRWFAVENLGTGLITFQVQSSGYGATADLAVGKIGLLVSDGQDVRFVVPDAGSGVGLLEDLSNVSGTPTDHQLLRYVSADNNWEPWTLALAFSQLTDFPGAYGSNASKLLAVKDDGTGLVWVSSSANVTSFTDLDDTPSNYSGAAGRTVKVNTGGTALIFAQPKLTEASDFPSSYTGSADKFPRVNPGATAVVFDTLDVVDLTDGPGAPAIGNALQYVRVKSDGSGLEYGTGTGGPDHFYQLADVPSTYAGQSGKYTRVKSSEDGLEYHIPTFVELADTPANFTGAAGKFAQVNAGATALQFGLPKVTDISDGPGAFTGNTLKTVRVNAAETALEYHLMAITELVGFPSSFTGQGGKFLQVNTGGTGVQFVTSSYTTNFLALTDTPSSYTGAANKFIQVDPTGTGLIFSPVTIPVKLGDLADVEAGTGTPAQGNYLRWIDGVWQADPGSTGGATSLSQLTDVVLASLADGDILVYNATSLKFENQPNSGGAEAFIDLTDVPAAYTGDGGKYVRVKADESGLEFVSGGGGGASDFTDLGDVPSTYVDQAGKLVAVNATEDALEFRVSHEVDYRGPYGADVADVTADFDSGIPAVFTDAAVTGWTVVTNADATAGTTHALKSLDIGGSETTDIHFDVLGDVGGSTMTVRYLVSSEGGFDRFQILVDGSVVFTDSGNTGAYEFTNVAIDEGIHAITFRYVKDSNGDAGDDCVYISQVIYPTLDGAPFVQGDTVDFDGYRYMCLVDNTILDPSNASDWVQLDGAGASAFTDLTDVPPDYTGMGGKIVSVKEDESGLEFIDSAGIAPTPKTFGSEEQTSTDNFVAGQANAVFVTMNQGDTLDTIGFYADADEPDVVVVAFVYDDNAGVPGDLMAVSDAIFGVGAGENFISISPVLATLGGRDIWIGLTTSDADFTIGTRSSVVPGQYWTQGDLEIPDPAPTTTAYTGEWTIWGTGTKTSLSFTSLDDTPEDYTGSENKAVTVNGAGTGLEFSDRMADLGVFIPGIPDVSEICVRYVVASGFNVLATGHQASANTAATATTIFTFSKNGVSIGTATFAAAGTTATFSISATYFAPGDVYSITAPSTQDATLADISFTLRANRN